jgi:hypothetical protein
MWCQQVDFDPRSSPRLAISEQLETPVIYFYAEEEMDVQVDVAFPKGIITEVYPKMSHFTPPIHQVSALANGTARWNVHIHNQKARVSAPYVDDESIWAPSRRVTANMLTNPATSENEHLIFYRGVAQRESEIKVTSTQDRITVTNPQSEDVAAAFVLVSDGEKGSIRPLGRIAAGKSVSLALFEPQLDVELYVTESQVLVERDLLNAGLFALEARAMVETWSISYFRLPGVRVLFVAPRVWTDRILPITIKPAPHTLERVLIGRVEVMLHSEEQRVLSVLNANLKSPFETFAVALEHAGVQSFGRFAEAKLRRAAQLVHKPTRQFTQNIEQYITEFLLY